VEVQELMATWIAGATVESLRLSVFCPCPCDSRAARASASGTMVGDALLKQQRTS
jgi:hypothetical protein